MHVKISKTTTTTTTMKISKNFIQWIKAKTNHNKTMTTPLTKCGVRLTKIHRESDRERETGLRADRQIDL